MSWTDLFRSRSGSSKADPTIRWFGKLPTYSDYYRSHSDAEWVVEFNSWVLKGFELYKSTESSGPGVLARLPTAVAVVRLPKSKVTVFTSVLDYGGDMRGRPFPLLFYLGVPSSKVRGPGSAQFPSIDYLLGQLLALRREVARFVNSPGNMDGVFGDRQLDLQDVTAGREDIGWQDAGKTIRMSDWFDRARGTLPDGEARAWLDTTARWTERIREQDGKSFEPTFRFPLAERVSRETQVAGWLYWLERNMNLADRRLSLFVTGDPDAEPGQLSVVARELMVDDFLLMTSVADTLPFVDSLCGQSSKQSNQASGAEGEANIRASQQAAERQTGTEQASTPEDEREDSGEAVVPPGIDEEMTWLDFVRAAHSAA